MISVVIPALNEAGSIAQTLSRLQPLRHRGGEVVLVDGGSVDQTVEEATPYVDQVIRTEPGRALQMGVGAAAASGDQLWFLHADTLVPEDADRLIEASLRRRPWGRFDVRLSGSHRLLRIVGWMMNRRSCWSGIATGDQGIFLRRTLFEQVGGMPPIPLMEDVAFSRQLLTVARPDCIHTPLVTSSRRWEQHGIVRTIVLMWWLRFAYWIGISPQRISGWYR